MRYLVAALIGALLLAGLWGGYERRQHTGWRDYAKALERASAANLAASQGMRRAEVKAYQEKADAADTNHLEGLGRARTLSAHLVDLNRMRAQGDRSPASALNQAGSSAVPTSVPSPTVVDSSDVLICGDLYAYSVAAHEWAVSVSSSSGDEH